MPQRSPLATPDFSPGPVSGEQDEVQQSSELNTGAPLPLKIRAILDNWYDPQGFLQVNIRTLFNDMDSDQDGKLEWNTDEIRRFVRGLFERTNIPWPKWQEAVFYQMYRDVDVS